MSPDLCDSVGRALSGKVKGSWFDSREDTCLGCIPSRPKRGRILGQVTKMQLYREVVQEAGT